MDIVVDDSTYISIIFWDFNSNYYTFGAEKCSFCWSKKLSFTLKPSKEIGEFTLEDTVLIVWLALFLYVELTFIGTINTEDND